jgi:hypothetical protein
MPSQSSSKLIWRNNSHLIINNLNFNLSCDTKELQTGRSTDDTFLLGKLREMVEKSYLLSQNKKGQKNI